MSNNETLVSFDAVSFEYAHEKPILSEVSFAVRRGKKYTLMGQNGAGKSTIFDLITKRLQPESGKVNRTGGTSIAISRQVIPRDQLALTVREFFEQCFTEKIYDIDKRIDEVLEVVNLKGHEKVHDRIVKSFSGGQQARLLLASALIQDPDLLLLDEPTNNLDKAGIAHLTDFLMYNDKTCIVISHDTDFLNMFTDGVLYLDVHTHQVEQYDGNYYDVVEQIANRIEKENSRNAALAREIQENKDQANVFAHKGGGMRLVAKRMREKVRAYEEEKIEVRREDKTIRGFTIPMQEDIGGILIKISSVKIIDQHHKPVTKKVSNYLKKNYHLLLSGPNGIGKSTLLEAIAKGDAEGTHIADGVKVGYYRQDFSTLNFDHTVYESLLSVMGAHKEELLRSTAAGFLIGSDIIKNKIGSLSEGQKGLVAFAQLVLMKPGVLILDEPTNHINFRHLPLIAKALDAYEGAMILVSHVPEFVSQIRIDETLDLESLRGK